MSYVRTPEEIQAIQALLQPALFTLEGVGVEFTTTHEFLRAVLPPCFGVPDAPKGTARVARWQSAVCGEYESCAVMVNATFGDLVGSYFLTLFVSGDMPVSIGRELYGEPKKAGRGAFFRDGNEFYVYGERNGVRAVEISATFSDELGESRTERSHAFELKADLAPNGDMLGPPSVLVFDIDLSWTRIREGTGELKFNGTPWDPVHEIPVVEVGRAQHYTGENRYVASRRVVLDESDKYLPYVLGRHFDDLSLFPAPKRLASLASRSTADGAVPAPPQPQRL